MIEMHLVLGRHVQTGETVRFSAVQKSRSWPLAAPPGAIAAAAFRGTADAANFCLRGS
jgi:hypothetical protein